MKRKYDSYLGCVTSLASSAASASILANAAHVLQRSGRNGAFGESHLHMFGPGSHVSLLVDAGTDGPLATATCWVLVPASVVEVSGRVLGITKVSERWDPVDASESRAS